MDGMQHLWFWGEYSSIVSSLCEALSTEVNGSEYCRKPVAKTAEVLQVAMAARAIIVSSGKVLLVFFVCR